MKNSTHRGFNLIELIVVVAILAIILVICAGGLKTCNGVSPNYSNGSRSGQVFKISEKGLFYKSWEGELLLASGVASKDTNGNNIIGQQIWAFSCTDEDVATALGEASTSGERVTLHYSQYLIGPISQSTPYTVTSVERQKPLEPQPPQKK